jgi:predicted nucleic acid-binding protein
MRFFFDTSVLLPCFFEDHVHHEASLSIFRNANRVQDGCAAHSLAEFYAIATRYPGRNRLSAEQVLLFLDDILERLTVVALTVAEYHDSLKEAAAAGVVGGTTYDALLARCAMKAGAEYIYTWNVKHFRLFSPDIVKRIRTP